MGSKTLRTKARRDMWRQRASFLAIAVTIFLGVALFGASYDAYRNLDSSYQRSFAEYRFANLTVTGGDSGRIAARSAPGGRGRSRADPRRRPTCRCTSAATSSSAGSSACRRAASRRSTRSRSKAGPISGRASRTA